ncbi:MAG: STAS domain-containing protein [Phycisphaerales bacterium]
MPTQANQPTPSPPPRPAGQGAPARPTGAPGAPVPLPSPPPPPPATEEGLLTVRGLENAGLVFITCPSIHEHQAAMIRARLLVLAERTHGRIAVSLENVIDMTSSGINAMVAVNARCRELGGGLALFGLSRDIRRMLRVTRLDRAIAIAQTPHDAVRALDKPRRGFWSAFSWARPDRRDAA